MVTAAYVPDRGHHIKIDFNPGAGREQAGWRPALVLSPANYNRPTGLAVVVPITNQQKAYPFEVPVPHGLEVCGIALSDAVRSLDWRDRKVRSLEAAPPALLGAV